MITREMESYSWNRPTNSLDSYGQTVSNTTFLGTMQAAIYFDTQVRLNNPLYSEATHVGLTKETSVLQGDLIADYKVLQVNTAGRYTQLVLKGE
jgi:hypothetical protein